MKFKCLTCGAEMEVYKYSCSVDFYGGGFCRDAALKKETNSYGGRCPKCETDFYITSEQTDYVKHPEKEGA